MTPSLASRDCVGGGRGKRCVHMSGNGGMGGRGLGNYISLESKQELIGSILDL